MTKSVRVTHITDSLTAGILQVVKVITGPSSRITNHSIVYVAKPGTLAHSELRNIIDSGVELSKIGQSSRLLSRFWCTFRASFKALRDKNIDIVHAHSSVQLELQP
jgi:hypothetical protein